MLAGILAQQVLEKGGTCCQHETMAMHLMPFASESNVHKSLASQQLWKCGPDAAEVTVPSDAELLGLSGTHGAEDVCSRCLVYNTTNLLLSKSEIALSYLRLLKDTFGLTLALVSLSCCRSFT